MHRLSMLQALSLWSDFEDALQGKNSYRGDQAEVYLYRLQTAEQHIQSFHQRLAKQGIEEGIQAANESLHNLLVHFSKTRNARVEIEVYEDPSWTFKELGPWLKEFGENHRWHVRIRPRD